MFIIRNIILCCVMVLIPFSTNGITLVKHLCCGVIEKTEIVFFATNDIEEDDHHSDDSSICCEETESDDCCDENSLSGSACGDELIVIDGCDYSTITFLKDTDSFLKIICYAYLPSIECEPIKLLLAATVLEPPRDEPDELSLSHTNQILRL